MCNQSDVRKTLHELGEIAIKLSKEWKEKEKVRKERILYVRYNIATGMPQFTEKEVIDFSEIHTKIVTLLEKSSSFEASVKAISKQYNIAEKDAKFYLIQFINKIVALALEENVDSESVSILIDVFIHDLEKRPVEWIVTAWLHGIEMKADVIELERGIMIRKPRSDDLEYEFPLFEFLLEHTIPQFTLLFPPSAILEMKKQFVSQPQAIAEIKMVELTLQLCRVGSVSVSRIEWRPLSFLRSGVGRSTPFNIPPPRFKYTLDEEDKNILPAFFEKLKRKIRIDEKALRYLTEAYLKIAILRYQDALLKPEDVFAKIAYAVMGLDALYLEGGGEAQYKLAQRAAKLLGLFGEDPEEVYDILKNDAYKIRSAYVHGNEPPKTKRKPNEILNSVIEYLRKSILIFMHASKNKKELLDLIDRAMRDKKSADELRKCIEELNWI